MPELWGGSADLAESNNTTPEGEPSFLPPTGRARRSPATRTAGCCTSASASTRMGAIMNGITAHGGTRPYGGTFLIFSDYMRRAVRLAALMRLPVIYVWTHDSIGLGEDGPTHQPIEHLAALRAIPGLDVVRPADANETAASWAHDPAEQGPPRRLILSRQNVPIVPRGEDGFADTSRGGEGRLRAQGLRGDTGRDPDRHRLRGAARRRGRRPQLAERGHRRPGGVDALPRVVRRAGPGLPRLGHPAGSRPGSASRPACGSGWRDLVGDAGRIVSINHYGASASGAKLFEEFGFTPDTVVKAAKESIEAARMPATGRPHHRGSAGRAPADPSRPRRHHQLHRDADRTIRFKFNRSRSYQEEPIMSDRLKALADAGVSIWLDDLSRDRHALRQPGRAGRRLSVVGVTTNPTIFATATVQGPRVRRADQGTGGRATPRRRRHQGADHRRRAQRLRRLRRHLTRPPGASTAGSRSRSTRAWPWTPTRPPPRPSICGRSSTGPTC